MTPSNWVIEVREDALGSLCSEWSGCRAAVTRFFILHWFSKIAIRPTSGSQPFRYSVIAISPESHCVRSKILFLFHSSVKQIRRTKRKVKQNNLIQPRTDNHFHHSGLVDYPWAFSVLCGSTATINASRHSAFLLSSFSFTFPPNRHPHRSNRPVDHPALQFKWKS